MKEETSMNVWKEWNLIKIHFLTRNDDFRNVAGNWTWLETGPHTVLVTNQKLQTNQKRLVAMVQALLSNKLIHTL